MRSIFVMGVLAFAFAASAQADPAELDSWCTQVKLPSSIALCSDPELRELAVQRNRAFEVAHTRLSSDTYKALLRDQREWISSYSKDCGLNETQPPTLPLSG